ncbi:MAG TPA: hypothetical protein VJT81_06645 [Burkholderiales bacterium]|nr:hypothetical protein [Burkholderiales bacterium]
MAVSSLLGEFSGGGHGAGQFVTSAFTPPSGSLLVVIVYAQEQSGSNVDVGTQITVSGGGHAYTPQVTVNDVDSWTSGLKIYTAPVTTGASMQLTIDCGAYTIYTYRVVVLAVTAYDTGTPTGATASAATGVTNGAETLTLSGAPALDSVVIAALATESVGSANSVLHGTGWTELYDVGAGSDFGSLQVQTRTASTSTGVGWDDVSTDAGGLWQNIRAALEIRAGAGPAVDTGKIFNRTVRPRPFAPGNAR